MKTLGKAQNREMIYQKRKDGSKKMRCRVDVGHSENQGRKRNVIQRYGYTSEVDVLKAGGTCKIF